MVTRGGLRVGCLLIGCLLLLGWPARSRTEVAGSDLRMLWHAETPEGRVLRSSRADEPINPASLVKLATSLWALERLGPTHRFETGFEIDGAVDPATGTLTGNLRVHGGGDPDFHVENAYLVARELNRRGVRAVSGSLVVGGDFWLGWEGGSEKREPNPRRRRTAMATRLGEALDPDRWSAATRRSIDELRRRRGWDGPYPRVAIRGGTALAAADERSVPPATTRVVHRSNPLALILKRLNSFSNNDIERLETTLGPVSGLAGDLVERWQLPRGSIRLATYSGLGTNRMSPGQLVRLLAELRSVCTRLDIGLADILPVAGCDPGTLERFPSLAPLSGELVAKTGTLTRTDGGVAALAGVVRTAAGERLFSVVAPDTGTRPGPARRAQAAWVLELAGSPEAPRTEVACPPAVAFSDDQAQVQVSAPQAPRSGDRSAGYP